jgi:hypothetical protein
VRAGDVILDIAGTVLMRIKSGDSTHFVAMPVAAG